MLKYQVVAAKCVSFPLQGHWSKLSAAPSPGAQLKNSNVLIRMQESAS